MKKANLYIASLAAVALALTGCDDTTDGGVMQVNPQLPEFTPENISVAAVSPVTDGAAIDLAQYINAGSAIDAVAYTTTADLPEGASVSFEMQVSTSSDFAGAITLPMEQKAGTATYTVDPKLWDNAFRSLCGKAPYAQDNYVRYAGYISVGSQRSRIGTLDTWYAPAKISVTPVDLGIVVEEAYYLVGTANDWNLGAAIKFDHSDKNVYDDPVFTLAINVTAEQAEAGWWWKIVPESAFKAQNWDALFGPEKNGDQATEGILVNAGNATGAGELKNPGQQLFTIDMLACTYKITNAVPMLWTPGNSNGWSPEGSGTLTTGDFTSYTGFLHLNGEWLMTPAPNWDNKYALGSGPGTLAFNGSSNLPAPAEGDGLYWVNANLGSLTYSTTPITAIGLIGDFNGWGGDVDMTPSEDFLTWTGTLTVEDGQGWKFRCNHEWAVNLGGSLDDLVLDGGNITVPAGTYTVTLSLATHPYTATLTAK